MAPTFEFPFRVNEHVLVLFPPLEQAPDHTTSRLLVAASRIDVPRANGADPLLPTVTLIPAGVEVTRSPLRPVAVTVSVAVCAGGAGVVTASVAVRVTPPNDAVMVVDVDDVTAFVLTSNDPLVAPAATVIVAGIAALVLLLDSCTVAPPEGAAVVSVTVPREVFPPTTLVGLSAIEDSAGADAMARGVKRRTVDHAPAVPAELTPRTRHQCRRDARLAAVYCEGATVALTTIGEEKVLESSTWTR